MSKDIERRYVDAGRIEVRKAADNADGPVVIRGYAAKFNTLSDVLWGFREQIAPEAFKDVLENDVRCFFNHDDNLILGRSGAGTLRLSVDDVGLLYECDLPDTQAARDLMVSMERGDVNQSSFAFSIAPNGDRWDENDEGVLIRTVTKVSRLFDVSPVSIPAYPDATVGLRSMEEWKRSHQPDPALKRKRQAEQRVRQLRLIGVKV